MNLSPKPSAKVQRIEVRLRDVDQLFNSMDPAPFYEKDLDHDAEEFIESWAMAYPQETALCLLVHLDKAPASGDPAELIRQAIHHFYATKSQLTWLEFRRLMKQGRTSLLIGVLCLVVCLLASELLLQARHAPQSVLRESLLIGGWVAMWRPMEIFLYEWWPLIGRARIYRKLSHMPVEIRLRSSNPAERQEAGAKAVS